jgi:hypothetical protein
MLLAYFATDGDLLLANELEILGKRQTWEFAFSIPKRDWVIRL